MIKISTDDPVRLFGALRDEIRSGRIQEWSIDEDGDFTYAYEPWKNLAWIHVKKTTSGLRANIIGVKEATMSDETYAVYHSRFAETLVLHFEALFDTVEITALATESDIMGGSDLREG